MRIRPRLEALARRFRFSGGLLLVLVALAALVSYGLSMTGAARRHAANAEYCEAMRRLQESNLKLSAMTPDEHVKARRLANAFARERDRFARAWPWEAVPEDCLKWRLVDHDPVRDVEALTREANAAYRKFYKDVNKLMQRTPVTPPPPPAPRGPRNPT
jgi:hypothetical protein